MKKRIILLANTCPYGGEVFLQNELSWKPSEYEVILYPIFAKTDKISKACLNSNIEVRILPEQWTIFSKIVAGLSSIRMLITTGEYIEALSKPKGLRNLFKAFKFAFISELRLEVIRHQLHTEKDQGEGFLFYSYWMYETSYVAAKLKESFPNSVFVSRCHGFDLYEIRHPNGYLPFRNYLMNTVDNIFMISEDGRNYLDKLYTGKWSSKIKLSRLGTNDYGLNPDTKNEIPIIVSCSNLVDVKRVNRIVEGLAKIGFPIRWRHFGDGELRDQLEKEAQKLPAHIDWKFMGSLPNKELMQYYKEHHIDAFINVSSSEGVPVSIMEGLSFGIPIIATDVGGTHEIVFDRENGILLPSDFTDQEFLRALNYVFSRNTILRKKARETWSQVCNAGSCYGAFYKELMKFL